MQITQLDWSGHGEFLSNAMSNFFRSGYQVDTSVTFRGERLIGVHRLLMSAFLPTFKRAVDAGVAGGPLTELNFDCVAGSVEDITALLEFIYTGRTAVSNDRLNQLSRLAEDLCFDGLSEAIADHIMIGTCTEPDGENDVMAVTIKEEPSDDPNQVIMKTEASDGEEEEEEDIEEFDENSNPDQPMTTMIPEDVCSVVIKSDEKLSSHDMRTNDHSCSRCDMLFISMEDLRIHFRCSHPSEKLLLCYKCDFHTTTQQLLYRHVETAHSIGTAIRPSGVSSETNTVTVNSVTETAASAASGKFPCNQCGTEFTLPSALLRHVAEEHKVERQHHCAKCPQSFASRYWLAIHTKNKHLDKGSSGSGNSRSSHMGKAIHTASELAIANSLLEGTLRCELCTMKFDNKMDLKIHFRCSHPTKKLYECKRCDFVAVSGYRMERHRRRYVHNGRTTDKFACTLCGKEMTMSSSLQRHMSRVHSGNVKRFFCKKCPLSFATRYSLGRHSSLKHSDHNDDDDDEDEPATSGMIDPDPNELTTDDMVADSEQSNETPT